MEILERLLTANAFLTSGLIMIVFGALLTVCRRVPAEIWNWIKCRLVAEIEVSNEDICFYWFRAWLAEHACGKRALNLLATTRGQTYHAAAPRDWVQDETDVLPRLLFPPNKGTYWFRYRGKLVAVYRTSHNAKSKSGGDGQAAKDIKETYRLVALTRNTAVLRQLMEDVRVWATPAPRSRVQIMSFVWGDWQPDKTRPPRNLETVILPEGLADEIVRDVRTFLGRESWYLERGIPYRRSYVLHGPPGNGKSSVVAALASEFQLPVCLLSLSRRSMSDDDLLNAFQSAPERAFLLLEDIDCLFTQRKRDDSMAQNNLSFSGLLNAIDGVAAQHGRVLFMTTNFIDKLDPALLRDGRADRKVYLGHADASQAQRLFLKFFPGQVGWAGKFAENAGGEQYSMARLQGHLMRFSEDAEEAAEASGALIPEASTAAPSEV